MKYITIILALLFFAVLGCIESSTYKEISPSQLMSNPGTFEGKKICVNGILENNSILGIQIGTQYKNGTLVEVCGTYQAGKLELDFVNSTLSVSTERDVYRSNETLKVHVDFNSQISGKGQVQVSGIKNAFDKDLISEARDVNIEKGHNGFDFVFKTPSCEECSALSPGIYALNATVHIDDKTFLAYTNITLERET